MIPPSEYVESHGSADVALLFRLWAEGASAGEIARQFGVTISTVSKWRQRYKLPPRPNAGTPEYAAPSAEDERASANGLALSPWVEERAKECREKHYAERMAEAPENTHSKVSKWRAGICSPRGVA
jgi:hypothetical protein